MIDWKRPPLAEESGDMSDDEEQATLADAIRAFEEQCAQGPNFAEEDGPPVERDLIRRFVRREVNPYAAIGVGEYILRYRGWYSAWQEISKEIGREHGPDPLIEP